MLYGNTSPHLWEQLSGSTTCLEHSQDTGSNQPKKKKKGFEHLNYKVQSLWLLFLREFLRPNSELFIFRCDSKSLMFGFQTVEGGSTSGMHIYDDDGDVIANSYRQGGDK